MEFSRPEYWSGLPFPSPGDLPDPGIEPLSPALQVDSLQSEPPGKPSCFCECTLKRAQGRCTGTTLRDGTGGKWVGGSGWGTRVHTWLIHVNVWQKPLHYCKVISLQLNKLIYQKNKKNKKEISNISLLVLLSLHLSFLLPSNPSSIVCRSVVISQLHPCPPVC